MLWNVGSDKKKSPGSGHGLVSFTALLLFGVQRATGIELEPNKSVWSQAQSRSLLPDRLGTRGVIEFVNADICDWQDLHNVRARDVPNETNIYRSIPIFMHLTLIFHQPSCGTLAELCVTQRHGRCFLVVATCAIGASYWNRTKGSLNCSDYCTDIATDSMQTWWEENVVGFDKCPVILCGSRSGHTLYLFKHKSDATLLY